MKQGKGVVMAALLCMAAGAGLYLFGSLAVGNGAIADSMPREKTPVSQVAEESEVPWFAADLNHDGVMERLALDQSQAETQGYVELHVLDEQDKLLYAADLATNHMGEGSYSLYRKDGEDYLLYYVPYMSTGMGMYWYEIFYLDDAGGKKSVSGNNVQFIIDPSLWSDDSDMDAEEMTAFADEVNGLFADSVLLASTIGGVIQYSEDQQSGLRITEWYSFLDQWEHWYKEGDDLATRIEKYKDGQERQYRQEQKKR